MPKLETEYERFVKWCRDNGHEMMNHQEPVARLVLGMGFMTGKSWLIRRLYEFHCKPEDDKLKVCGTCDSQEARHYCLLHGKPMKNMDISTCKDWTPRQPQKEATCQS